MLNKRSAILATGSLMIVSAVSAGAAQAQTPTTVMHGRGPGQMLNINRGQGGMNAGARVGRGVSGKVTAISGTTITIESGMINPAAATNTATATTYTVDASKATFSKTGAFVPPVNGAPPGKPSSTTIAITDIAVGDSIRVEGTVTGSAVVATSVTVMPAMGAGGQGQGMFNGNNMVVGKVTAVSGTTLTVVTQYGQMRRPGALANANTNAAPVTEKTYTVDASNATFKKMSAPTAGSTVAGGQTTIAITDIAVGDTVRVEGTVSGTNVTATTVIDGVLSPAPTSRGASLSNLLNKNPQAAALKNEVEAVKPGLWNKIMSFFSGLFGKNK
jgi:hypothetical protein